jgi:hypothetical protein
MFEVYMLQPVTAACQLFAPKGRRSVVAEPALSELMCDPITLALMAADRVDHRELDTLLTQVRASLR